MDKEGDPAGRPGERLGEAVPIERERLGTRVQGHRDGQGRTLIGKPVTEEPVDHRQCLVAPAGQRRKDPEEAVGTGQEHTAFVIGRILPGRPIVDHGPSLRPDLCPQLGTFGTDRPVDEEVR